jgi:hypothetical protein
MKVDMELLKEQQAATELRNGITGLIGNITAYALVIPLFIFHWRLANKKTTKTRSRK